MPSRAAVETIANTAKPISRLSTPDRSRAMTTAAATVSARGWINTPMRAARRTSRWSSRRSTASGYPLRPLSSWRRRHRPAATMSSAAPTAISATDAAVRCRWSGPVEMSPASGTRTMTNNNDSASVQPARKAKAFTSWVRSTSTNTTGRIGSSDARMPRAMTEISTASRPGDGSSPARRAAQRPRRVGCPASRADNRARWKWYHTWPRRGRSGHPSGVAGGSRSAGRLRRLAFVSWFVG